MKFKFIGSFTASAFKKYDQNREIFFLSQKRRKFSQSEKKSMKIQILGNLEKFHSQHWSALESLFRIDLILGHNNYGCPL
jgi:hypothetical protein